MRKWWRRLTLGSQPVAKGSPAGEVMLECLRRSIDLVLQDDGTIGMKGPSQDVQAMHPHVEEHKANIFAALIAFKYAVPPPRLSELN